jgi:hypothetical protein
VPGFALQELGLFSEAGIPNAKVIEMATGVAARVLRKTTGRFGYARKARGHPRARRRPIADINTARPRSWSKMAARTPRRCSTAASAARDTALQPVM